MVSLEMPLIRVLAAMERRGIALDLGVLGTARGPLLAQMGRLQVRAGRRRHHTACSASCVGVELPLSRAPNRKPGCRGRQCAS